MPLLTVKQDMPSLGSAITYARRYALLLLCNIVPEDDDGNAAANRGNNQPPSGPETSKHAVARAPSMGEPPSESVLRDEIDMAPTLDALAKVWARVPPRMRLALLPAKDARKTELGR